MAANTEQQIRDFCGMPATTPSSAQIEVWTTNIRGVIAEHKAEAGQYSINIVELNTIKEMWDNRETVPNQSTKYPRMEITPEDWELLNPPATEDTGVDGIPMNGYRRSEIF